MLIYSVCWDFIASSSIVAAGLQMTRHRHTWLMNSLSTDAPDPDPNPDPAGSAYSGSGASLYSYPACGPHSASGPQSSRLRSASTSSLITACPSYKAVNRRRSTFPIAAARTWNILPRYDTSAPFLPVFCSHRKTNMFNSGVHSIDFRSAREVT